MMNENSMSPVQRLCYRYGVKPTESRFDVMLPKVMELAWIPVSERLPDVDEEVLTYLSCRLFEINSLIKYSFSKEFYWENQNGDTMDFEGVEAWMPLPPEYKGEGK